MHSLRLVYHFEVDSKAMWLTILGSHFNLYIVQIHFGHNPTHIATVPCILCLGDILCGMMCFLSIYYRWSHLNNMFVRIYDQILTWKWHARPAFNALYIHYQSVIVYGLAYIGSSIFHSYVFHIVSMVDSSYHVRINMSVERVYYLRH